MNDGIAASQPSVKSEIADIAVAPASAIFFAPRGVTRLLELRVDGVGQGFVPRKGNHRAHGRIKFAGYFRA